MHSAAGWAGGCTPPYKHPRGARGRVLDARPVKRVACRAPQGAESPLGCCRGRIGLLCIRSYRAQRPPQRAQPPPRPAGRGTPKARRRRRLTQAAAPAGRRRREAARGAEKGARPAGARATTAPRGGGVANIRLRGRQTGGHDHRAERPAGARREPRRGHAKADTTTKAGAPAPAAAPPTRAPAETEAPSEPKARRSAPQPLFSRAPVAPGAPTERHRRKAGRDRGAEWRMTRGTSPRSGRRATEERPPRGAFLFLPRSAAPRRTGRELGAPRGAQRPARAGPGEEAPATTAGEPPRAPARRRQQPATTTRLAPTASERTRSGARPVRGRSARSARSRAQRAPLLDTGTLFRQD